jgi:hypothetical protein
MIGYIHLIFLLLTDGCHTVNLYGQIHLIASLTAGLTRYHDEFAVAVVDEVC